MLASSVPLVHATGVNWDSVLTIVGAITAVMVGLLGLLHYYQEKRETATEAKYVELRNDFKESIESLGNILEAKLSTKDDFSILKSRVSYLEGQRNAIQH